MSIQFTISILRDAEVDARKAHHLAQYINQNGANMEKTEQMETYARNALVSIYHALREAEQALAEAEKKEESK